ncbi:GreA/GreB family elongation factor [Patescibacteria group bacterium]|nr:GreA/GreB family elongation factor [Patescibacteria group bacterium]
MDNLFFTKQGYEKIKEDNIQLEEERKDAVLDLKKAREMGDLSENGYYKAARFKLGDIDRGLRKLSYLIKYGKVAEKPQADVLGIGSKVRVEFNGEEKTYEIVGEQEANPLLGKISYLSPLGKELIGKKELDEVIMIAPMGKKKFLIKTILS